MNALHAALVDRIGEMAYVYERIYHGCSQCVLGALQECMGLGNRESFKAATALAGGVARTGSTCGALVGAIMAVGLAYGREDLEDSSKSQGYTRAMDLSAELCQRFEKEFGSSQCRDIQRTIFDRNFDLRDPLEREEFRKAGGHEKSALVARRAAELAATVILENGYEPGPRV